MLRIHKCHSPPYEIQSPRRPVAENLCNPGLQAGWIQTIRKKFHSSKNYLETSSELYNCRRFCLRWGQRPGNESNLHTYVVPKLRMSVATPPFHHMPLWSLPALLYLYPLLLREERLITLTRLALH